MFPGGTAGAALLILRLCAGGALLLSAFAHNQFASPSWILVGLGLIVLSISAGAITPIACAVAGSIEGFYLVTGPGVNTLHTALALLITVSLALLGPGAISIDAKIFGRRLILPDHE
jgi:hypothetical protein